MEKKHFDQSRGVKKEYTTQYNLMLAFSLKFQTVLLKGFQVKADENIETKMQER